MSYEWWARWDRVTCQVTGHAWLDHRGEWLGGPQPFSTCIRCGASERLRARRRQRLLNA